MSEDEDALALACDFAVPEKYASSYEYTISDSDGAITVKVSVGEYTAEKTFLKSGGIEP